MDVKEEVFMERVVIIGAGPAGLAAAYHLLKNGEGKYQVTILEATEEIGGISRTVNYKGNRMDIGGHRFFTKDPDVKAWWEELLPLQGSPAKDDAVRGRTWHLTEGGPDPETADETMLVRQRISRIFYRRHFFDYPVTLNMATIRNLGPVTCVEAGLSYLKSCVFKKKEDSLENFYINRFGRKLYSIFFESYTEKVWGLHPSLMSADWGSQRVKGLSVTSVLKDAFMKAIGKESASKETSLIEEFWYPKLGPGQIYEKAAREILNMGGELHLGLKVSGIEATPDGQYHIQVIDEKGVARERLTADYVVSSMPLRNLCGIYKGMPEDVKRIGLGLKYRDFVTLGLLVDKLALGNGTKIQTLNGQVPDCWIYVQDKGVKLGRIQIFNNWSPYLVEDPEHTVWIGLEYFCSEGDRFWNMAPEELADYAREELARMGVIDNRTRILDYHKDYAEKAYPCYFGSYKELDKLKEYLDTQSGIVCVGRNGQHRYNNMDHSIKTAMLAADYILDGTRDTARKKAVWEVNTEGDYHESKD